MARRRSNAWMKSFVENAHRKWFERTGDPLVLTAYPDGRYQLVADRRRAPPGIEPKPYNMSGRMSQEEMIAFISGLVEGLYVK